MRVCPSDVTRLLTRRKHQVNQRGKLLGPVIALLIDVHDACGREAVEGRAAGRRVSPDIRRVKEIAEPQVRQVLGQADRVEGITGRAEDGADLSRSFLEA